MSFGPKCSEKAFIFFESEFGSIPKISGLNPWSFQFWGILGWDPAPSPPTLIPAAGSASGISGLLMPLETRKLFVTDFNEI